MPALKQKPIEERDPYAALCLAEFDRQESNFKNRDIASALAPYHRGAFKPSRTLAVIVPDTSDFKLSAPNLKLAAALALIITMAQALIRYYESKSGNQMTKSREIERRAQRILARVSHDMSDTDIFIRIGKKIDAMNEQLGFSDQPSWIVYMAFSIAILSNTFADLKKTRLHNFDDELEELLTRIQQLHDYMAKRDKANADAHNAKAAELYKAWEGLF